ncbi:MAG: hypothetical protein GDA49_01680, partial [Rhodospirillales bacterium]|nr:hypothetical protein [Rhodospirillales bacterium]
MEAVALGKDMASEDKPHESGSEQSWFSRQRIGLKRVTFLILALLLIGYALVSDDAGNGSTDEGTPSEVLRSIETLKQWLSQTELWLGIGFLILIVLLLSFARGWFSRQHFGLKRVIVWLLLTAMPLIGYVVYKLVSGDAGNGSTDEGTLSEGLRSIETLKQWLSRKELWIGIVLLILIVLLPPYTSWTRLVARRFDADSAVIDGHDTMPEDSRDRAEVVARDLRVRARRQRSLSMVFLILGLSVLLGGFYFVLFLAPILDLSDEHQRRLNRIKKVPDEVQWVIDNANGWFHVQPLGTSHVAGVEVLDPETDLVVAWLRDTPELAVSMDGFETTPDSLDLSKVCGFGKDERIVDLKPIAFGVAAILGNKGTLTVCVLEEDKAERLDALLLRLEGASSSEDVKPRLMVAVADVETRGTKDSKVTVLVGALHASGEANLARFNLREMNETPSSEEERTKPKVSDDPITLSAEELSPMKLSDEWFTALDIHHDADSAVLMGNHGTLAMVSFRNAKPQVPYYFDKVQPTPFSDSAAKLRLASIHDKLYIYEPSTSRLMSSLDPRSVIDLRSEMGFSANDALKKENLEKLVEAPGGLLAFGSHGSALRFDPEQVALHTSKPKPVNFRQAEHFNENEELNYVFTSDDGRVIVVTGDEGSFVISRDGGETWSASPRVPSIDERTDERIRAASTLPDDFVWGSIRDSTILNDDQTVAAWDDAGSLALSDDGGMTWRVTVNFREDDKFRDSEWVRDVQFLEEDKMIAVRGDEGSFVISLDGGATWSASPRVLSTDEYIDERIRAERILPGEFVLDSIILNDGQTVAAWDDAGSLALSDDGGMTWPVTENFREDDKFRDSEWVEHVRFLEDNMIAVWGHEGSFVISLDGGATWSASPRVLSTDEYIDERIRAERILPGEFVLDSIILNDGQTVAA